MPASPNIQSSTTWAIRNPTKDVQPTNSRARKVLTTAEKVTRDARRKVLQSNSEAFRDDVLLFQQDREAKIQDLAKKHCKTAKGVRTVLTSATHYKQPRAPTLQNALVHHKTEEVNSGMLNQCCPLPVSLAFPRAQSR